MGCQGGWHLVGLKHRLANRLDMGGGQPLLFSRAGSCTKAKVGGGRIDLTPSMIQLVASGVDRTQLVNDRRCFGQPTRMLRVARTVIRMSSSFSSSSSPSSLQVVESSSDSPSVEVVSLSSGGMILTEVKAYRALQVIKQCHSFDSIVIEELLGQIRKRNNIPGSYKLHAPRLGQHRYDPFPNGFGLSINVLQVLEANPPVGGDAHPKKMSKLGVCKVSKSTIAWEAAVRGGSSQRWVKSPKPSGQGACLAIWSQPCYEEGYSPKVDEGPVPKVSSI
ncbi:hypothetical protein BHM03_00004286 [Ensete ventricosum]|nr:hypothetical protein BHM03_00004286 [Ensete ventricosum]